MFVGRAFARHRKASSVHLEIFRCAQDRVRSMTDNLYFNGRFTTTDELVVNVEDRGFQFGDAVYEVFKFLRRKPILIGEHFRRMERGLREIEITNPWSSEEAF